MSYQEYWIKLACESQDKGIGEVINTLSVIVRDMKKEWWHEKVICKHPAVIILSRRIQTLTSGVTDDHVRGRILAICNHIPETIKGVLHNA